MCVCSSTEVGDKGRFLMLYISRGAEPRQKIYYCDLSKLDGGNIQGAVGVWDNDLYHVHAFEWDHTKNIKPKLLSALRTPHRKLLRS